MRPRGNDGPVARNPANANVEKAAQDEPESKERDGEQRVQDLLEYIASFAGVEPQIELTSQIPWHLNQNGRPQGLKPLRL